MTKEEILDALSSLFIAAILLKKNRRGYGFYMASMLFTHWGIIINPRPVFDYLYRHGLATHEITRDDGANDYELTPKGLEKAKQVDVKALIPIIIPLFKGTKIEKILAFFNLE